MQARETTRSLRGTAPQPCGYRQPLSRLMSCRGNLQSKKIRPTANQQTAAEQQMHLRTLERDIIAPACQQVVSFRNPSLRASFLILLPLHPPNRDPSSPSLVPHTHAGGRDLCGESQTWMVEEPIEVTSMHFGCCTLQALPIRQVTIREPRIRQ